MQRQGKMCRAEGRRAEHDGPGTIRSKGSQFQPHSQIECDPLLCGADIQSAGWESSPKVLVGASQDLGGLYS